MRRRCSSNHQGEGASHHDYCGLQIYTFILLTYTAAALRHALYRYTKFAHTHTHTCMHTPDRNLPIFQRLQSSQAHWSTWRVLCVAGSLRPEQVGVEWMTHNTTWHMKRAVKWHQNTCRVSNSAHFRSLKATSALRPSFYLLCWVIIQSDCAAWLQLHVEVAYILM